MIRPDRRVRKFHLLLPDELMSSRGNHLEQRGAFEGGHFRRTIGVAAEGEGRSQDELFEVLTDIGELAALSAPPGGDRRQLQFFAEQMAAETRQEGEEGRAFQQAAAERVDDGHSACARGFDQSGHAEQRVAAHLKRIAEGICDAAQNHVHLAQAFEGFHEHPSVAHGEILTLDQREAEQSREISVLEVGLVAGAGREQDDGWILLIARCEPAQGFAAQPDGFREAPWANGLDGFRENARDHRAILEHEADAGRRLRAIGHHPPLAIRRPCKVHGVGVEISTGRRRRRLAGAMVVGVRIDERRGDEAIAHEALHAVEIFQDEIQETGSLDQAGFELAPFLARNHQREQIKSPRLIDAAAVLRREA